MKYKRVIVLLADGARPDVMDELLDSGELPAIKQYLAESGTSMKAVSAFPSTTGPAYMPFLTGCLPATCNVPGIRWVDKVRFAKSRWRFSRHRSYVGFETYLLSRDMRRELPTLFELLPRSYNIFNSVNKGVTFLQNQTRISRIWYWYYAHLTDRWNFVDKCAMKKFKHLLERDFDMIFMILPGIDEYSHIVHYRDPSTIEAYRRVNETVELAFTELSKRGLWDDTLFWLISDHGLSETHTHFCVNTFLEKRGIKTFYYPKIYRQGCEAANMVSGNGMTHIYFKHDHGWQYPMYRGDLDGKYKGLVEDLVSEAAVDVVAYRLNKKIIEVATRRGRASIELEGDFLRYEVDGDDPFGFSGLKNEMSADDLLRLTMDTDYPDAVYQLAHLFTSPRCGDIVLSASLGYDLRDQYEVPEHKGSHGSLHREHMLVPLITNAKVDNENVRTVDVFPTMLKLLGHPVPANIDGKSLV